MKAIILLLSPDGGVLGGVRLQRLLGTCSATAALTCAGGRDAPLKHTRDAL